MQVQAMKMTPEVRQRLLQSRIEAETLRERDLFCPVCGYRIQRVYSDATGHLSVKCQKCKSINILNLAYFRKIRHRKYGTRKWQR